AWINGQVVATANSPDPLAVAWNSLATASHASSLAAAISLGNFPGLLRTGTNILAIQGLNLSASDPTFLLLPELIAASVPVDSANGLYFPAPTPGAANNSGTTNLGPLIFNAAHTPNVPRHDQDLLVTAQLIPTFGAVSNA